MSELRHCSLLVVDDNADTRSLFTTVLEIAGADVIAVSSAIEALDVLHKAEPDALICDLVMPELDGFMFIDQLRSSTCSKWRRLPAIAVSALALEHIQLKALDSGFHSVLSKPISPEELVTAVADLAEQAPCVP